ncbi:hypothetical protein ACU4GD_21480 [Cupriavidus basilensis]
MLANAAGPGPGAGQGEGEPRRAAGEGVQGGAFADHRAARPSHFLRRNTAGLGGIDRQLPALASRLRAPSRRGCGDAALAAATEAVSPVAGLGPKSRCCFAQGPERRAHRPAALSRSRQQLRTGPPRPDAAHSTIDTVTGNVSSPRHYLKAGTRDGAHAFNMLRPATCCAKATTPASWRSASRSTRRSTARTCCACRPTQPWTCRSTSTAARGLTWAPPPSCASLVTYLEIITPELHEENMPA